MTTTDQDGQHYMMTAEAIQNTARTLFEQSRKIRKLESAARSVVAEYYANQETGLTAAIQKLETLIPPD